MKIKEFNENDDINNTLFDKEVQNINLNNFNNINSDIKIDKNNCYLLYTDRNKKCKIDIQKE